MKRKLNLLLLLLAVRHQLAWKIARSANPAPTTKRAQSLALLARRVADARFTGAHLTSWPNPQMFAGQTTDTPALHLCVEEVTASISRSDIIGAAIKKYLAIFMGWVKNNY